MNRTVLVLFAVFALAALRDASSAAPPSKRTDSRPDPASVREEGAGYRYPQAGWIVVHIEGTPYERGYQHGKLLSREIADYVDTLAVKRSKSDPSAAWRQARTLVNALFLRKYAQEYLEEMKGIADGAAEAGAKIHNRPIDFLDVVSLNSEIEAVFLEEALDATANGLEGKVFDKEPDRPRSRPEHEDHCSAFAATGPATADGKIVFGHITMFNIAYARHFNVWLDVKPDRGRRVLMQTYPGGIQSGLDYYMNDAGLIVCETTIDQTKFDASGEALASRIRRALQYSDTIDQAVEILGKSNNGLYSNEWLLADTKTNEIAMYELGTHKTRLWRSSKKEWFGGTEGFYWGCNNAKDIDVRLETLPSVKDKPANVVFHPSDRDRTWLRLFDKHKGKIGEDFGFEAFTTPPLSAFSSLDAKFTTADMAKDLKTWAIFGPPLGRTWDPTEADRQRVPRVRPLVSNDWTVLTGAPPALPEIRPEPAADLASNDSTGEDDDDSGGVEPAWRGTFHPAGDADVWLAAAFADYEKLVALERSLKKSAIEGKLDDEARSRLELARFAPRSRAWAAIRRLGDDPRLSEIRPDTRRGEWYPIAVEKGIVVLEYIRKEMGDDAFLKFMNGFGVENAGKPASTEDFLAKAEAAGGKGLKDAVKRLIASIETPDGPAWSLASFEEELESALIVYGTAKEAPSQREAAFKLQRKIARKWSNIYLPVKSDTEVTDADIKTRHLLLVGRPDSNRLVERCSSAIAVKFGPASFVVDDKVYAHEDSAIVASGPNPFNPRYSIVLHAGLSAEATWYCVDRNPGGESQAIILAAHSKPKRILIKTAH